MHAEGLRPAASATRSSRSHWVSSHRAAVAQPGRAHREDDGGVAAAGGLLSRRVGVGERAGGRGPPRVGLAVFVRHLGRVGPRRGGAGAREPDEDRPRRRGRGRGCAPSRGRHARGHASMAARGNVAHAGNCLARRSSRRACTGRRVHAGADGRRRPLLPPPNGAPTIVAAGLSKPRDVAVDASYLYWTNAATGRSCAVPSAGAAPGSRRWLRGRAGRASSRRRDEPTDHTIKRLAK